jgi:peptide/nickel transport system permease protein
VSRTRYAAARLAQTALTIFVVASFNFWLFRILPGNYTQLIGRAQAVDPSVLAAMKKEFGLEGSLGLQYVLYLKNLVTLHWGFSYGSRLPVTDIVGTALKNTVILIGVAYVVMVVLGILLGVLAGARRGTRTDTTILTGSLALWSLPTFWFGLFLILIFSVYIGGLPVAGMSTFGADYDVFGRIWDTIRHLVLPTITIALGGIAQFVLIMRNSLVDVLDEDYVTTARAKGLKPRRVLWRHAVPNAFLPTFTLTSLNLGILLAGTIQVETVFSWPGIGQLIYNSVTQRDYPVLEISFLVIAFVVIVANLVTDVLYVRLDPRIEHR